MNITKITVDAQIMVTVISNNVITDEDMHQIAFVAEHEINTLQPLKYPLDEMSNDIITIRCHIKGQR